MNAALKSYTKGVSLFSGVLKLIPIPIGLFTAKLMSKVVMCATEGDVEGVINGSLVLLGIVIGANILKGIGEVAYEKLVSQTLQKCKVALYKQFLMNPLHVLYGSKYGVAVEGLSNDFEKVTSRNISMYPNFGVGILTALVYFVFLGSKSIGIALALFILALVQVIPPCIVKKYMQVNYGNCRDIEAKLTDFTLEGYRGLATIKMYDLKEWWLEKLGQLHKAYSKIGSTSIYTASANNAMNKLVENILKYGAYGIIGMFVLVEYTSLEIGVQAITLSEGFFAAVKMVFDLIPEFAVAKTAEERILKWCGQVSRSGEGIKGSKIELLNTSYGYEGKNIFNQVECVLAEEKVCVIKGENGIGKSTLFRLITGLVNCQEGLIRVGGVIAGEMKEEGLLTDIFYLPQEDTEFGFSPKELYEMIIPNQISEALHLAQEFGLTKKLINQSTINQLSGGERKKVFLVLALIVNPRLLLLDEPTNNLDVQSKQVLCERVKKRCGGTLIITHDPVFDSIVDQVYILKEGEIYYEAT